MTVKKLLLRILLRVIPSVHLRSLRHYLGGSIGALEYKALWYRKFLSEKNAVQNDQLPLTISFNKAPSEIGEVTVGPYSYSATPIDVYHVSSKIQIMIGKYTSIGRNLKIISTLGHNPINLSTSPFLNSINIDRGNITIGNDVWIGDDVTIMGGVTIRDGCVIGTKALILKDTEPFGIYGGVPAKLIHFRFKPETIKKLQMNPWWELPRSILIENSDLFEIDKEDELALKLDSLISYSVKSSIPVENKRQKTQ